MIDEQGMKMSKKGRGGDEEEEEEEEEEGGVMRDAKREEGAAYGVLGTILALILVNGRVLGDGEFHKSSLFTHCSCTELESTRYRSIDFIPPTP